MISADTKDALARELPDERHCRDSLLAGLCVYGSIAGHFVTHRNAVARLFWSLLEERKAHAIETRAPTRLQRLPTFAVRLPQRLGAVLDAIYAAFAEGWTDPAGADTARRDLAEEALFLARLVTMLLPGEAEALGLLALLLYAEARRLARRGASGEFVPLAEQDQALWDRALIAEAEALLLRASALGDIGRFQLEAAIQSAHVDRCLHSVTNWSHVVGLYDGLFALTGSPVVLLNRALAIAALDGPASGLAAMPSASDDPRLIEYQPYWAARADLLARNGASAEARAALEIAMGLERDPAVRRFLEQQRAALPD